MPVIVVRPTSKREKKKRKRQANPNRRGYLDILEQSGGGEGAHVLNGSSRNSIAGETLASPELEAEAVAAAIGLPPELYSPSLHPPSRSDRARSTDNGQPNSPAPRSPTEEGEDDDDDDDDALSHSAVIMKSPNLSTLDSPVLSDSDASDEADDDEPERLVVDMPPRHRSTLPEGHATSYSPTASEPITDAPGHGGEGFAMINRRIDA